MYPKVAQFKSPAALRARLAELELELPVDDEILTAAQDSPLAQPLTVGTITVGNRWCIHPMEGWDAHEDGSPTEKVLRRWRHFGISGAKLIWGGEAAAVVPEGRANPHQTLATPENRAGLAALLHALTEAHAERFGRVDDLLVGLQLTHSGRFCHPTTAGRAPRIAYHHPLLDAKYGLDPHDESLVLRDDEISALIERFVAAAALSHEVGFRFVDIKACHGYLLHEFLSARTRLGPYGGDLAGRARLLLEIIERIRRELPDLIVGVRLSAFDLVPFATSREVGQPMPHDGLLPYRYGFGVDAEHPLQLDLSEPIGLLQMLAAAGVSIVNLTAGSPYYSHHIQRPAIFPPSDGYQPPEDPLVGVWRQIDAARRLKQAVPNLPLVGTGYTYLQDFMPQVAQGVVRAGWIDSVGIGRMVLSYPELPADVLANGSLARKRICRTFSDCTTAPRNGLTSGCYPLDPYYKSSPEAEELGRVKGK
jgi:2,4-dienoyl-CoA reductase-like NADH-dependent reductase (Old Yellow Enzyme family)